MRKKIVAGTLAASMLAGSALVARAQGSNELGRVFERQMEQQMILDTDKLDRLDRIQILPNQDSKFSTPELHTPNR